MYLCQPTQYPQKSEHYNKRGRKNVQVIPKIKENMEKNINFIFIKNFYQIIEIII